MPRDARRDRRPTRSTSAQACEASLRRLGVETIDLYQQHRVDPRPRSRRRSAPSPSSSQEGKIRYIGLSEAIAVDIRRAAAVHPIASVQSEYSLLERGVEDEVLDTCEELGIGFLPVRAARPRTAGRQPHARAPARRGRLPPRQLLPARGCGQPSRERAADAGAVHEIAAAHDATPAKVALAWLLVAPPVVIPIPGTKRSDYLEDNAGATDVQLSAEDERRLDSLAAEVQGPRYGSGAQTPDWVSPPLAS